MEQQQIYAIVSKNSGSLPTFPVWITSSPKTSTPYPKKLSPQLIVLDPRNHDNKHTTFNQILYGMNPNAGAFSPLGVL